MAARASGAKRQGLPVLADRAYISTDLWGTTPARCPPRRDLSPTQHTLNRALSAIRAPAERGVASLKSWRIFHHARCGPNPISSIASAVLTQERQR
ncbi:transposase family protein [Streptomyces sp. NPDC014793]|uniref:transposase family protein n=1 Tax=Streptomyces sp. NPDC014793 TaxID=3364914 RepID=UPI0036FB1963